MTTAPGVGIACHLADWTGHAWDRLTRQRRQVPRTVEGARVVRAYECGAVDVAYQGGVYYVPEWRITGRG
jgi:hypothetical protein